MLLSNRIKTALLLWCIAEVLAFYLVVHLVGFGWAFLAGCVTSMVGFALLKRTGTAAIATLRASFRGRASGGRTDVVDGGLSVLGALALLLPGFLSDIVGILLAVRPLRDRFAAVLGTRGGFVLRGGTTGPHRGPVVVDLTPDEWQHTEGRRAPELH